MTLTCLVSAENLKVVPARLNTVSVCGEDFVMRLFVVRIASSNHLEIALSCQSDGDGGDSL